MTVTLLIMVGLYVAGMICFYLEEQETDKQKEVQGKNYWEHN